MIKINKKKKKKENQEKWNQGQIQKQKHKIGQWNEHTFYQKGNLEQTIKKMQQYKLDLLGI